LYQARTAHLEIDEQVRALTLKGLGAMVEFGG